MGEPGQKSIIPRQFKMSRDNLILLKLGGSLISDKTGIEIVRDQNLEMLSRQLAEALNEDVSLKGLCFGRYFHSNKYARNF